MRSVKINCALAATLVFWASAFVGIRIGLTSYSPGPLALLRFLIASCCMAMINVRFPAIKKIPWSHRLQLMVIGMAGIGIYNICLNYGEVTVSASVASFVIGLIPVITILLSLFLLHEQINAFAWLGIGISLLGLLVMVMGEQGNVTITSDVFIILIAALMGGIYTITQKRYLRYYQPIAVVTWIIWGGTCLLLIFAPGLLVEIHKASTQATLAAVYMGVFPAAIAYVAWSYVLNHLPVSTASLYLYILPLLSTILGIVWLHEQPSLLSFSGGLIALLGAVVANYFKKINPVVNDRIATKKRTIVG